MLNINDLQDSDFEKLANDIEEISKLDENEIYRTIGLALHREGLTSNQTIEKTVFNPNKEDLNVSHFNSLNLFAPKTDNNTLGSFSGKVVYDFISKNEQIDYKNAEKEGEAFWETFKEKLRIAICTNENIVKLINGDGKLTDYLKVILPLIAVGLGVSLSPVMLSIIIAALALLIKVGLQAYCSTVNHSLA